MTLVTQQRDFVHSGLMDFIWIGSADRGGRRLCGARDLPDVDLVVLWVGSCDVRFSWQCCHVAYVRGQFGAEALRATSYVFAESCLIRGDIMHATNSRDFSMKMTVVRWAVSSAA